MMGSEVDDTSGPIPVESTSSMISPPPTSDNHLLLVEEQKMFDIVKPHHQDVLCGRGVTTNRHPGNESFRSLVGLNKELYVSSTKREKMGISRSIVQAVRSLDPPGRFLDKDPLTGLWHDIGHKKAVEKTSQALRDGAAMLRKQLSDDLGDPAFLDGMFSEEGSKEGDDDKKKKGGKEKVTIKTNGKENNKETKGHSPEKVKAIKTKSVLAKKGHRRIKSNPSELAKLTSKARRNKTQDEPRTPGGSNYAPPWNYSMYPPSPRSPGPPPPSHVRSLPNSPMTYSGGPPPYPDRHRSYPHSHHSPYHQAPHSPYSKPPRYSRSHSFDYHGGPSDPALPPRHHSWSPYESSRHHDMRYHHQHSHNDHYYHHQHRSPPPAPGMHPPSSPAPTRSSSPPSPTSSSGPMPPGQHKYSPGDYYSNQPQAEEPWSPRRGYMHEYEAYDSPRQHPPSPYHQGEYIPERSSSWTPRSASPQQHYHNDHYYDHPDYYNNNETSSDLSVPCLRGEGRPSSSSKGRYSPHLHLSPRSTSRSFRPVIHRPSGTPPRPPPSYDRDRDHQQDFRPPSPRSPRYQRPKEDPPYYHCDRVEEEKKTSDMDEEKIDIAHQHQSASKNDIMSNSKVKVAAVPPRPESVKSESRLSSDRGEIERECPQVGDNKDKYQSEHRASPGKFIPVTGEDEINEAMEEDNNSEEGQPVDDISMSPLPYDREDPVTLLDLPDDIMNLPISSCGPHDDRALD